jgi:hypothetical protein
MNILLLRPHPGNDKFGLGSLFWHNPASSMESMMKSAEYMKEYLAASVPSRRSTV